MVSFEDDDDPAVGSGDESQDEDEVMEDADGDEGDVDATMADEEGGDDGGDDEDNEDNDDDDQDEPESPTQSRRASRISPKPSSGDGGGSDALRTSPSPRPPHRVGIAHYLPQVRPEAITATTYDIVPTMAAPQSTSINAVTATPDMRWVFSGGADGYVRMYDWVETANGKVPLTVAQKHPFVDSVMKAGSLTTYWENEEVGPTSAARSMTTPPNSHDESKETSPVYALAVQHQAVWLLSGLESGGINLQTCRHQAGTRITTLREHTSAVSVLRLGLDEQSVLSGSWDKRILDWDLNTGRVKRTYPGSGAQISAIEVRPASKLPVPKLEEIKQESDTFSSNNNKPVLNGSSNGLPSLSRRGSKAVNGVDDGEDAMGSPDGSLFGENDHMSLFGDGEDNGGGGGGGGGDYGDDDDAFGEAIAEGLKDDEESAAVPAVDTQAAEIEATGEVEVGAVEKDGEQANGTSEAPVDMAEGGSVQPVDGPAPSPPADGTANGTNADKAEDLPNGVTHAEEAVPSANEDSSISDDKPNGLSTIDASPQPESETTFLDTAIDGTIRIWDRRVSTPVARILPQRGTPPWCMGACWSPEGDTFYVGRRNGTVDEYSLHLGGKMADPVRSLRFPAGSGAVSAVRAMPNGRGLVCASHDILRLYDLKAELNPSKHSAVPFLIVPGHRTGIISALHIDPTCRFMISTAGNRGWEGASTEVLLGYEIGIPSSGALAGT